MFCFFFKTGTNARWYSQMTCVTLKKHKNGHEVVRYFFLEWPFVSYSIRKTVEPRWWAIFCLFLLLLFWFLLSKIFLVNWKEKDSFWVFLFGRPPQLDGQERGNVDDNGENCTSGETREGNEWKNWRRNRNQQRWISLCNKGQYWKWSVVKETVEINRDLDAYDCTPVQY